MCSFHRIIPLLAHCRQSAQASRALQRLCSRIVQEEEMLSFEPPMPFRPLQLPHLTRQLIQIQLWMVPEYQAELTWILLSTPE